MKTAVAALLVVASLVASGCTGTSRWRTTRMPDSLDAARMLGTDTLGYLRDQRPEEVPLVPIRKRLRPCCAFGTDLRVRVGAVHIPGFQIDNILSPDEIGSHTYDAGQRGQERLEGAEHNGLVYTCRGGFIDTAHVRDYADWTLYLATMIGRHLETGAVIDLPDSEGGQRRFVLEPVDSETITIIGRRNLTAALAVWAGFQLSVWHEIATWYGWSSFGAFPERASAFSPEDLYSNMLGAKLVGPIISAGNDLSENLFNQAVDVWLSQTLAFLGGVSADLGREAIYAVEGTWWDSEARLPDAALVLRRQIELGQGVRPWLVPFAAQDAELAARLASTCDGDFEPRVLRNPSRIPGLDFESVLHFEIELDETLRDESALRHFGGTVEYTEFPEIFEQIRVEAREEFGPLADSPALD